MNEYPADIAEKALSVRNSMCMDCECKFVAGCVCLDNVAQALMEERERCAMIAEHLNGWGADCGRGGHAMHIAAAIRSGGE